MHTGSLGIEGGTKASPNSGDANSPAGPLLTVAALVACWLPLLWRLSRVWSLTPEQAYGWTVPALAVWCACARRGDAPAPQPLDRAESRVTLALVWVGLGAFILALPVLEANPLWPTVQWIATAALALATLAALAMARGWPTAGHYAFPVAFFFTALSWPAMVTVRIVATLAGAGAQLAAELVSLSGYPANATGSVIEVGRGFVGVDEACSGLRSFQAVWMAAWFFGEFHRFSWGRRLRLTGLAMLVAWLANVGRITFLTWQAAVHGIEASTRWHDTAGGVELVVSLLAVAALARAFAPRREVAAAPAPASVAPWRLGGRAALAMVAGGLMAEALTQIWYGWHERAADAPRVHWRLVSPSVAWQPVGLSARVSDVLQFTEAQGLEWRGETASFPAAVYVVSWQGDVAHGESADWHDPTICVPAAGARLVRDLGLESVEIDHVRVGFNSYLFDAGGRPLTVYFCHWDAEIGQTPEMAPGIAGRRLERVWQGRRQGDVAHMTFVVRATGVVARDWLHEWAPRVLHTREPVAAPLAANPAAALN
jgi:exosortase